MPILNLLAVFTGVALKADVLRNIILAFIEFKVLYALTEKLYFQHQDSVHRVSEL